MTSKRKIDWQGTHDAINDAVNSKDKELSSLTDEELADIVRDFERKASQYPPGMAPINPSEMLTIVAANRLYQQRTGHSILTK